MNIHEIQLSNNNTKNENDSTNDNSKEKNQVQKGKNEITEEKLKNIGIKSLLGGNIYTKKIEIVI